MKINDRERQERLEARRLADALDAVEEGRDPEVDAREDPELFSLLATAEAVRTTWRAAAPEPARAGRLRSSLLGSAERAAEPEPARPARVVPLYRRWSVLSPVASAAAAAVITFAITTLMATDAPPPGEQPLFASAQPVSVADLGEPARPPLVDTADFELPPATEAAAPQPEPPAGNLTSEALAQDRLVQDLKRIESVLQEIRVLAERGKSVDAELLRTVTEGTARVASQIATAPESVSPYTVATYFQSVSPGREILSSAQVAEGDESALDTARDATLDGLSVAVRYFTADKTE